MTVRSKRVNAFLSVLIMMHRAAPELVPAPPTHRDAKPIERGRRRGGLLF